MPACGLGIDDDCAVVDEHLHDLLDEERVAIGSVDDQVDEGGRQLVDTLQHLVDELASCALRQTVEVQPTIARAARPAGSAFVQARTGSSDDEQAAVGEEPHQPFEEGDRVVVGPVQILDDDHRRIHGGHRSEVTGEVCRADRGEVRGCPRRALSRRVRQIEAEPVPDLGRPRFADIGAETFDQLRRSLVR